MELEVKSLPDCSAAAHVSRSPVVEKNPRRTRLRRDLPARRGPYPSGL